MTKNVTCKNCGSQHLIKYGFNKNKHGNKQKYLCKSCGFIMANKLSLKGFRTPAKKMGELLDDYNDGKSFNKIGYRTGMSTSTFYNWMMKLPNMISPEVNRRVNAAKLSSVRHADISDIMLRKEKVYNKKKKKHDMHGRKVNLWGSKDNTSKFIVSQCISVRKDRKAAFDFFQGWDNTPRPRYIVTDGAFGFAEPIKEVFNKGFLSVKEDKVKHIVITKARRKKDRGVNNQIERWFDTVKSRSKVTRRYQKIKSLICLFYMFMVNYNFLKPHFSLKRATPAEIAGIGIKRGKTIGFYDLFCDFRLCTN